jgi:hypothetical protein
MVQFNTIFNGNFTATGTTNSVSTTDTYSPVSDCVVAIAYTANWSSTMTGDITISSSDANMVFGLLGSYTNNSDSALYIWVGNMYDVVTNPVVSFTWSDNAGSGFQWGCSVLRFSGSNYYAPNEVGIPYEIISGNPNFLINANQIADNKLPSFNFTTVYAQSLVFLVIVDWDANTHTTRTFSTVAGITPKNGVNEILYTDAPSNYSLLIYYWNNVGVEATNTYALVSTVVSAIESTQAIIEVSNNPDEYPPDTPPTYPGGRPSLDLNGTLYQSLNIQNIESISNVSSMQ